MDIEKLKQIAAQMGPKCEIVADFSTDHFRGHIETKAGTAVPSSDNNKKTLLSMLKRRPCSIDDICAGLNMSADQALEYVNSFQQQGLICSEQRGGTTFFKAN